MGNVNDPLAVCSQARPSATVTSDTQKNTDTLDTSPEEDQGETDTSAGIDLLKVVQLRQKGVNPFGEALDDVDVEAQQVGDEELLRMRSERAKKYGFARKNHKKTDVERERERRKKQKSRRKQRRLAREAAAAEQEEGPDELELEEMEREAEENRILADVAAYHAEELADAVSSIDSSDSESTIKEKKRRLELAAKSRRHAEEVHGGKLPPMSQGRKNELLLKAWISLTAFMCVAMLLMTTATWMPYWRSAEYAGICASGTSLDAQACNSTVLTIAAPSAFSPWRIGTWSACHQNQDKEFPPSCAIFPIDDSCRWNGDNEVFWFFWHYMGASDPATFSVPKCDRFDAARALFEVTEGLLFTCVFFAAMGGPHRPMSVIFGILACVMGAAAVGVYIDWRDAVSTVTVQQPNGALLTFDLTDKWCLPLWLSGWAFVAFNVVGMIYVLGQMPVIEDVGKENPDDPVNEWPAACGLAFTPSFVICGCAVYGVERNTKNSLTQIFATTCLGIGVTSAVVTAVCWSLLTEDRPGNWRTL